jgi:membrane protease YdiL (CAAX protease family)
MTFAAHVASLALFYLGWEFHFRGFLQQGLAASLGPTAGLWVQVLASCLLHFDRPDAELWASIPAAILWGLQANYTGAVWAGFAQHWLLGATLDYFICF